MTFSNAGRCSRTGQLGIGIATSSPVVGSRCVHVSREAAVACHSVPDPPLGARTLRLVAGGTPPHWAIDEILRDDSLSGKRQIGIIDGSGRVAGFTGDLNVAWAGHLTGTAHIA